MGKIDYSVATVMSNKCVDGVQVLDIFTGCLYAFDESEWPELIARSRTGKRLSATIENGVVRCDDDRVRIGLERRIADTPMLITHKHGFTFRLAK